MEGDQPAYKNYQALERAWEEVGGYRRDVSCVAIVRLYWLRIVGIDFIEPYMGVPDCSQVLLVCCDL